MPQTSLSMKKMKHMFYLIFLPLIIYAQKNLDPRLNGIDPLITGILKEWNVPGCAITIVEKNDIIFMKGYGYRKLNAKQPVNKNTVFPIASCTKAFTAALIGILVSVCRANMKFRALPISLP